MIPNTLAELIETGARQEEALRANDIARALRLGELRDRACRRLEAELEAAFRDGSISEGDLAGGLRQARAANLRTLRLARSIARDLRREIDRLEPAAGAAVMASAGSPAGAAPSTPRYLDRRG